VNQHGSATQKPLNLLARAGTQATQSYPSHDFMPFRAPSEGWRWQGQANKRCNYSNHNNILDGILRFVSQVDRVPAAPVGVLLFFIALHIAPHRGTCSGQALKLKSLTCPTARPLLAGSGSFGTILNENKRLKVDAPVRIPVI
jgi:hypothetical protein